jgi:hypothetical protein
MISDMRSIIASWRFPLRLERRTTAVSVGVDNVDRHRAGLEEPIEPVNRLNEVVELEADAGEDRPVAVALQVAAAAEHDGLGAESRNPAVAKSAIESSRSSRSCEP